MFHILDLLYPTYMFHLLSYYFLLHHMHIHTSILFILHRLLLFLHLYIVFILPNIVLMSHSLLMSNNISLFINLIMTDYHITSILYLYHLSSMLCYCYLTVLLDSSYLTYMFHLLSCYFMHCRMHIHTSILFTLHFMLSLHYLNIAFRLPNIVLMLHSLLMSNNISLFINLIMM